LSSSRGRTLRPALWAASSVRSSPSFPPLPVQNTDPTNLSHSSLRPHPHGRHAPRPRKMPSPSRPENLQFQPSSLAHHPSQRRPARSILRLGPDLRRL
jgi:hypothetical protein